MGIWQIVAAFLMSMIFGLLMMMLLMGTGAVFWFLVEAPAAQPWPEHRAPLIRPAPAVEPVPGGLPALPPLRAPAPASAVS